LILLVFFHVFSNFMLLFYSSFASGGSFRQASRRI
jgi:hypothetical protein